MAGPNNTYNIIDEPKTKPWEHLIVNPLVILLAAMFLPLFWNPPFYGRLWLPLLWLTVNSWLLGSPTFRRELIYAVGGMAVYWGLFFGFVFTMAAVEPVYDLRPFLAYLRILLQGIFFLTLYLIVFKQSISYELFIYLRSQGMAR